MGDPMCVDLDFKSQFYNLQGINISDRKKNFSKLLKSTSLDTPEDEIDIQPRNYQENIFYVDVLIHFKKVDKLLEILKEGVGVLSSRILKQRWFFQVAFNDMSEEDVVNKFLPTLSYSLRMKVLKKLSLSLNEERMNRIFDLVLERYGLFIAKQFLFSCSPEKIVHVLKNNEVTLSCEQLKRILQKDLNLIKVYLEESQKNVKRDDFDFLSYLVWKHPNLYFEYELKNRCGSLGRYTTRAVIKSNKEKVLKEIDNCKWNKGALVRDIKEFDNTVLVEFFPEDINDLNNYSGYSTLKPILLKYPIKKRWPVLSQAFKQAYSKEVIENLDKFSDHLAQFFPQEIKQKWAEMKYLEETHLRYIKYCNPMTAVKLLKDKINVTSDLNQRSKFLNELISVCYENKDYSTYEEVLKYISTRHRNDDTIVRGNLIYHINSNTDYKLLTQVHWKYINVMVDIRRVKGENLPFEIITEYLLFLYKTKVPLDEPVAQYAKDCIKANRTFRLDTKLKEREAESNILKRIVMILPTLQLDNARVMTYKIMSDIVDFNKDIKNDKTIDEEFKKRLINLNGFDPIMNLIKEVGTKKEPYDVTDYDVVISLMLYNCLYSEHPVTMIKEDILLDIARTMSEDQDNTDTFCEGILAIIKKPKRNNFENNLLDYFFTIIKERFTDCVKKDAIKHFANREPEVIAKYFSVILPLDVKYNNILDYGMVKRYSHLSLDKKLILHFKDLVSLNSKCEKKVKLLNALSMVMNTKDFLILVKDYIPYAKKLDLNNAEQKEMYQVQCDLAKAFKNLDEPVILAPVLMHFCQGDYLQSSIATLYSILYRINEEKASSNINVLGARAVSTRKHAVYLAFEVLSLKDAVSLHSALCSKETNISAKKYLFNALLNFFQKNPLESLLDFVFLNMDFIDKNDSDMIEKLIESVKKIPNKYAPIFIEKVWNYLDILEQNECNVIRYQQLLINKINDFKVSFLLNLKRSFCENVIKKYFLSDDDKLIQISFVVNPFVTNYLLAYLEEQYFQFVFNIIKSYKDLQWDSNEREKINYVLEFFSKAYAMCDENDVSFLKLFQSFWQQTFNDEECFSEYILLGLMVLYKENPNIEQFSKQVDRLFQELSRKYGPHISELLVGCITEFFDNINTENKKDFNLGNFCFGLLESNRSEFNCFITFRIIKEFGNDQKDIYFKITDVLRAVDTPTVRIYYNVLLKKKDF